jgi:hypothetical protein
MSGFANAILGNVLSSAIASLEDVLFQATRVILPADGSAIVPNIVIEESGSDQLDVTSNPVEYGAAANDHAYKIMPEFTMRLGWTNSTPQSVGSEQYVQEVYYQLLTLQASRQLMSVVSGKRFYTNLLITSLNMRTDASSEYALMIELTFKQLNIVYTSAATLPPQSAQAQPDATAPVVDQGTKAPAETAAPANRSILDQMLGSSPNSAPATPTTAAVTIDA